MSAGHLQHDVLKELHGGSLSRRVLSTVAYTHCPLHCMHVHAFDLGASALSLQPADRTPARHVIPQQAFEMPLTVPSAHVHGCH